MLSPADILAEGLNLALPPGPAALDLPAGTCSAVSGIPIARGYPVASITTGATAEFLDAFRGGIDGYVSVNEARCYKSANPRTGNQCARSVLAFADGPFYSPLINAEAALEHNRPHWSALARSVWATRQGERCLIILTTDTKKRLWPRARLSVLGRATEVLLHDGESNISGVFVLDWRRLLACLDDIEEIYSHGFAKLHIRSNLLADYKRSSALGFVRAVSFEKALAGWRPHFPEFPVALLMAQRHPIDLPVQPKSQETKTHGTAHQPALFDL